VNYPGPYTHVSKIVRAPGQPLLFEYGRGKLAPCAIPNDRAYDRRSSHDRELFELETVFHEDGTVSTPDFPRYKPTRAKHGGMELKRFMRARYKPNKRGQQSEMFVELECSCGSLSAVQASHWRAKPATTCDRCAKRGQSRQRFAAGYFCVDRWRR
jgi:hypothetical protein